MVKQNIYDNDEFFRGYKELRDTDSGLNGVLEIPALRSLLPNLQGKTVLDLGCGMGGFAEHALASDVESYVGVDISGKMLEVARDRIDHLNAVFVQGALEDFDIEPQRFDLVISSLCLHYIEDYDGIVKKVSNGLRPDGMFVFSVEHPMCTAYSEGSGWCENVDGIKRHRILDNYRIEGLRRTNWFVDNVIKYHRTMETYVNGLISNGLGIVRLLEPEAPAEEVAKRPDLILWRRCPPFLLLSSQKQ